MQVTDLGLCGLKLITPRRYPDDRGWFTEAFNRNSFAHLDLPLDFVQDNQSLSRQGVLRGLHYQLRQPQGKLIQVLSGKIWDVALDLRRASPTFGRWYGLELGAPQDADTSSMLWVPEGFAHGFLALSAQALVQYKVTRPYDPEAERTIRWDDPELGIDWPLSRLQGTPLTISPKDAAGTLFKEAELF
jgi:dTDP-4-dehydrorhamnose 3,5-epimerase